MAYRKKKQILLETANNLFRNTKINTTTEKSHLGAVIGSNEFGAKFVTEKVDEWIDELRTVFTYAKSNG